MRKEITSKEPCEAIILFPHYSYPYIGGNERCSASRQFPLVLVYAKLVISNFSLRSGGIQMPKTPCRLHIEEEWTNCFPHQICSVLFIFIILIVFCGSDVMNRSINLYVLVGSLDYS